MFDPADAKRVVGQTPRHVDAARVGAQHAVFDGVRRKFMEYERQTVDGSLSVKYRRSLQVEPARTFLGNGDCTACLSVHISRRGAPTSSHVLKQRAGRAD